MKDYYSMSEAAKICSVSRSTMNRWVKAGKIQAYQTQGGHKRIQPEVLKEWIKKNDLPFNVSSSNNKLSKILIVDDDAAIRKYLVKLLNIPFIKTQTAFDGFDAGKKVIQFNPDLVILDLSMPNMDGFEVCNNIKYDPSTEHIKIIILTGYETPENQQRALALGADLFLGKPLKKKVLLDSIEQLSQD